MALAPSLLCSQLRDLDLSGRLAGAGGCWKVGSPEVPGKIRLIYTLGRGCLFELGVALYSLLRAASGSVSVVRGEMGSGRGGFFFSLCL